MATGRMEFHARSIMQHANFTFVLPNDVEMEEVREPRHYERPAGNLILLHGLTGTDTDWLYGGIAQEIAIQYNMNVFMPTTGNSFYLDRGYEGGNYCTFVGEELPAYIQSTFGTEWKRESTMIGGLSMGGYGAIHTALAWPERFSACMALSSALVVPDHVEGRDAGDDVIPEKMKRELFGDLAMMQQADYDPQAQYARIKAEGKPLPRFYMACGTEDALLEPNRRFAEFLRSSEADCLYQEGPGKHDWYFWNEYLRKGMNYLL